MTYPPAPPPDPLWQPPPPPPFPDPLLQPSQPTWDRPPPPIQPPREHEPRATTGRAAPRVAHRARTTSAPPSPGRPRGGTSTPPTSSASPTPWTPSRPRSWRRLTAWIVAAAFLVPCAANAVSGIAGLMGGDEETATPSLPVPRDPPARPPTPRVTELSAMVDAGPDTSFGLPAGTGVRITRGESQWSVAVLAVEWLDEGCEDILGTSVGPVVVADIRLEALSDALLVTPLLEFRYADVDGRTSGVSLLSGCADMSDLMLSVPAGEIRTSRIAIEVPSGRAGELTYGEVTGIEDDAFEPLASWTVTANPR